MRVEYVCHSGDDLLVVNAARVSFAKRKTKLDEADIRLLHYLARHHHWTPFGQPQMTVRVKAPIFVARQLFRHKVGLVENEISRRYVDHPPTFYQPGVWRQRPTNGVKQGSGGPLDAFSQTSARSIYEETLETIEQAYRNLLGLGVAPEQARLVLPQALFTEWMWTGSLYAFHRIVQQRIAPNAQSETCEIAVQLDRLLLERFPESYQALKLHLEVDR